MQVARILILHTSSLVSGASSKYRKKYCDVYARNAINVQTDGIASREMENDEQSIFYAYGRPPSMIEAAADSETGSLVFCCRQAALLINLTCAGGRRCAWKYFPSLLISTINCSRPGYYTSSFTSKLLIRNQIEVYPIT